jgi:hypothetical protein
VIDLIDKSRFFVNLDFFVEFQNPFC